MFANPWDAHRLPAWIISLLTNWLMLVWSKKVIIIFLHQSVCLLYSLFSRIFIYLFTFYLVPAGTSKVVKITGIAKPGHTVSILMRGSNKLMLDEADRSLHDALCVIRCLVRKKFLIAGGGAPGKEINCTFFWIYS